MSQTPNPEVSDTPEYESPNLTKRQISHRDYYAKNKDRIETYRRKYHQEHREEILERVRDHYYQNRDKRLAYGKKWRKANADKMRLYRKNSKTKLRKETFEAYGGAVCACCGEAGFPFLTIDHINGDGGEHRRSIGSRGGYAFYAVLRTAGFPPGYQVLCFNCNMAKGVLGSCPHAPVPL